MVLGETDERTTSDNHMPKTVAFLSATVQCSVAISVMSSMNLLLKDKYMLLVEIVEQVMPNSYTAETVPFQNALA